MPGVDAGITGDPAINLTMAPPHKTLLRADQRTMDVLIERPVAGIDLLGKDKIAMPNERLLAANASIKDLGYQAIQQMARADLEQPNGGVEPGSVDLLREKGILDTDGKLTQLGTDVVMVRDDRIIREREALEPAQKTKIAQYFKTSGDYVREAFLEEREKERNKAAPVLSQDRQDKAHEQENRFQIDDKAPKPRHVALEEGIER